MSSYIGNSLNGSAVSLQGITASSGVVTVASGVPSALVAGTLGNVVTDNGSSWVSQAPAVPGTATNLAGGSAGKVVYQSGANTTAFVSLTGLVVGNGVSAPTATAITQYNVVTGGASNAPNSVAPGATGIPLISQGASSQPAFGTAVVAGGGTGNVSATAYTPLVGGTTSTGAHQSVVSAGTSGQALLSGGSSAIPAYGTLLVPAGGTGQVSFTSGSLLAGNGTGVVGLVNAQTLGYVVQDQGSGQGFASVGPAEQFFNTTLTGATALIATASTSSQLQVVAGASNTMYVVTSIWAHFSGTAFSVGQTLGCTYGGVGTAAVSGAGPTLPATTFTTTDHVAFSQTSTLSGQAFALYSGLPLGWGFSAAPTGGDSTSSVHLRVGYKAYTG